MQPHQPLFGAYNARHAEPDVVAKTFIMPEKIFGLLCKGENSLLIGPRGSGKTTLLKMLRPTALCMWTAPERSEIFPSVNFTAVYIAADSSWNDRMSLYPTGSNAYAIFEILRDATLVNSAMIAMVDAILECTAKHLQGNSDYERFRIDLCEDREAEFVREISKAWRLGPEILSLRSLRRSIEARASELDEIYFEVAKLKQDVPLERLRERRYLSIPILSAMQSFVSVANDVFECPRRKWAFCMDEIEILSDEQQRELVRAMRSTDQRMIFKLSASPFSHALFRRDDPSVPMGGNDFTPITLTFHRKHEAIRFGRKLVRAMLRDAGYELTEDQIFGESEFEVRPARLNEGGSPYKPGGRRHAALTALKKADPAFAKYLERRGIDLEIVHTATEDERAEIRKLIQIAEIRREFGRTNRFKVGDDERTRHRSRKRVNKLYTGAEALLTIAEGNPRWIIGIFRPLIDPPAPGRAVPVERQARSIALAISRYLSLLSTIQYPRSPQVLWPVTKAIHLVGKWFFEDITSENFKTEPALSVFVDQGLSDQEVEAFGAAVNQGAFVFIPSQQSEHCLGNIREQRFRLTYLLSPRYQLPLMYGSVVSLSRILHNAKSGIGGQYTLKDIIG